MKRTWIWKSTFTIKVEVRDDGDKLTMTVRQGARTLATVELSGCENKTAEYRGGQQIQGGQLEVRRGADNWLSLEIRMADRVASIEAWQDSSKDTLAGFVDTTAAANV